LTIDDYRDAGLRVVPLYGIDEHGNCECGDAGCTALFKHPRISNWQNVPHWSDENMEHMEAQGYLAHGFGFVLDQHFCLDVDPRNGGTESYERLCNDLDLDFRELSNFVVETGGGGQHYYFSRPEGVALVSHLANYSGLDAKSSGFIVGAGSPHASGMSYDGDGDLDNFAPCPEKLLELLRKPDSYRSRADDGSYVDYTEEELAEMLDTISPDCCYNDWVSCGMALHHASGGDCFDLWDKWSRKSSKYDGGNMNAKWHSFGKCSNPVTIGSLIHLAKQHGFVPKAKPAFEIVWEKDDIESPFPIDSVDLKRPIGFVGEITAWINKQSIFLRENLAVAAALNTIGNIGGMRFEDDRDGVTANTIFVCVAGSGSGKEAILKSCADLMRVVGYSRAVHGAIKSEQEIIRNLITNQACFFNIDEIGYILQKLANGQADYLKTAIPTIMSAYTKAASYLLISGDLKDATRVEISNKIKNYQKMIDNNEDFSGTAQEKLDYYVNEALPVIDDGIKAPFLSMIGFTTPIAFNECIDKETATNGFVSRSFIVQEHETNPRPASTCGHKPTEMTNKMINTLQMIKDSSCEMKKPWRIMYTGDKQPIKTTDDASSMLCDVSEWFWSYGERLKEENGLEAVARRGYEAVCKISFILAIPSGLRDAECIRWAFAFVKRDVELKVKMANVSINEDTNDKNEQGSILMDKVVMLTADEGERFSVIKQRVGKKYDKEDVQKAVDMLLKQGKIKEVKKGGRGRPGLRYAQV